MPLFYQQNINETEHLAIWSITEPLSFFEEGMSLDVAIQNEERKIQHLAVRLLFSLMMPEANMKDLVMADNGKPYLKGVPFHFSFSHCKGYAACAVSDHFPIGIDIEIIHPRIEKIADKFLSADEKLRTPLANKLQYYYVIWGAKEVLFKICF